MAGPGILTGGSLTELFSDTTHLPVSRGVFGQNPGATPKSAFNLKNKKKDAESRESMSRLFIEIPTMAERLAFLNSVSEEARPLAQALIAGSGAGGGGGTGFFDFLMTEAQEAFNERVQIADTLTDNYVVYFSGREPTTASYAGTLLNTYQDDQRVWFLRLYSEILRGTRLATRNLIARMRYDSFLVSGYLMNLNLWLDGETEITASRFSFQMLIKRLQILTPMVSMPTQLAAFRTPTDLPQNVIDNSQENLAYNAREGIVTPEVPPTAVDGPAAESTRFAAVENVREKLREKNKSDTEINQVLAESANMSVNPEVDPREQEVLMSMEGVDRVADAVMSTDPNMSNPENRQNDGVGGASNISSTASEFAEALRDYLVPPTQVTEVTTVSQTPGITGYSQTIYMRKVTPLQKTSGQRKRQAS
jgi:hypothetical protein